MKETHIQNLRILIGRLGGDHGAPDCKCFAEIVKIPSKTISGILCRTTSPWPHTAQVESALGLQKGWIDEDLSFLFHSSPVEIGLYRQISTMNTEKQQVLAELVRLMSI